MQSEDDVASDDLSSMVRLHDGAFYANDPHQALARLRREAPVYWYEPGQFWAISKYEDVRLVSSNPTLFSCRYGAAMYDNVNVSERLRKISPEMAALVDAGDTPQHELRRAAELRMVDDPPHIGRLADTHQRMGDGRQAEGVESLQVDVGFDS